MTTDLKRRYDNLSADIFRKQGQLAALQSAITANKMKLTELDKQVAIEEEVQKLLTLSASATWTTTKNLVEGLVTRAMHAIFSDRDYKFVLKQDVKRGANAVTFAIADNGMELDLADELGGGISDVVALILRIAFLSLYRPKLAPLLVLDEPLKHLASNYQPAAGRFLKQVCSELGVTMLITTHSKELSREADQLFRAKNFDGVCVIEEETTACDH